MISKFLLIFFVIFALPVFSQTSNNSNAIILLDSVKIYYGDTCNVGIKSNLISKLYKYRNIPAVNNYLNDYENIHNKIIQFRKAYYNQITKQEGMILDIARVFKIKKQQNIANVCGIYFGPDSVTSIALSYIITRSAIKNYFFSIIQLYNFDPVFKKELIRCGKDWFYSLKLAYLKNAPNK